MLYLYQTMNSSKLRNGESDVSADDVSLKKQSPYQGKPKIARSGQTFHSHWIADS